MPWRLEHVSPIRYQRNPLQVVVVQLRFQTILKVPASAADFQDLVRAEFPVYEERQVSEVAFNPGTGDLVAREGKQFAFKKQSGATQVVLANDSLTIETTEYSHHRPFLEAVGMAVDALLKVFKTVSPTRVGLRYINLINRRSVASELGRDLAWEDLVGSELLRVPGPAGLDDSEFKVEVTAPADPGLMTLRHGLIRDKDGERYRIDIDRYESGSFDVSDTKRTLQLFSDDCFELFHWASGPELKRWMNPLAAEETTDA